MKTLFALLAIGLQNQVIPARQGMPAIMTVSHGESIKLEDWLMPEKNSIVLFYQTTSSADKQLMSMLKDRVGEMDGQLGLRLIPLKSLDAPIAKQFEILETPTLMVMDRFGNLKKRTHEPDEILPAIGNSIGMARIKWVDEHSPEASKVFRTLGGGNRPVPGILKTMSLRPDLMEAIDDLSTRAHFRPGFLTVRTKEMIATYVSSINKCRY